MAKWKSEVLVAQGTDKEAETNDRATKGADSAKNDEVKAEHIKHDGKDAKSNDGDIGGSDQDLEDDDDGDDTSIDITEKMFDWCIAELRHKLQSFKQTGAISVFDGDVVKSDIAIPSALKDALSTAVAKLEDVPDLHRDWHPGSNEKVLDLVHPSLFPVIYGHTRILPDSLMGLDDCIARCGAGLTLEVPPEEDCALWIQRTFENKSPFTDHLLQNPFSQRFQWLPCEVGFSDEDEVK